MKRDKDGVVLPNMESMQALTPLVNTVLRQEVTPRQREILTLLYRDGLSVSECAARLAVLPSTVCRTRDRGLCRLRRFLRYAAAEMGREKDA